MKVNYDVVCYIDGELETMFQSKEVKEYQKGYKMAFDGKECELVDITKGYSMLRLDFKKL